MKFRCTVCGYVHEGAEPPAACPQCKAPASKFVPVEENKMDWAAEHVVGVAKGVDPEIIEGLPLGYADNMLGCPIHFILLNGDKL